MRALCHRQLAAILLLVLAAVLPQAHLGAGGAALDEGAIMRRLRRLANQAGRVLSDGISLIAREPGPPQLLWRI